jgi:hypothetical protein
LGDLKLPSGQGSCQFSLERENMGNQKTEALAIIRQELSHLVERQSAQDWDGCRHIAENLRIVYEELDQTTLAKQAKVGPLAGWSGIQT